MSIASHSVVGRILAEVEQSAKVTPLARLSSVEQVAEPDQVFELRRTGCIHEPPFATSFHFWAHALHAFLEGHGRLDLFEALATHGLCERVEAEFAAKAIEALTRRMAAADPALASGDLRLGYRMIDQDVMVSWVAESKGEQLAWFWARPDWLTGARPVDLVESSSD